MCGQSASRENKLEGAGSRIMPTSSIPTLKVQGIGMVAQIGKLLAPSATGRQGPC